MVNKFKGFNNEFVIKFQEPGANSGMLRTLAQTFQQKAEAFKTAADSTGGGFAALANTITPPGSAGQPVYDVIEKFGKASDNTTAAAKFGNTSAPQGAAHHFHEFAEALQNAVNTTTDLPALKAAVATFHSTPITGSNYTKLVQPFKD